MKKQVLVFIFHLAVLLTFSKVVGDQSICIDSSFQSVFVNEYIDIFYPFYTQRMPGQGTGLGLTIAQLNVHQNQGSIHAENLHNFVCFDIAIPRKYIK